MLTYGPVTVERQKPEQSHASAYLRKGRIILHGDCLTTIGGLACEPYLSMNETASNAEVGTALLGVLAEARVTPVPTDHKAEQKKILRIAGVRSWTKLSEGVHCSVAQEPSGISMLPSRRERRAFIHMPELAVRVFSGSAPDEVGRALRAAFQKCE